MKSTFKKALTNIIKNKSRKIARKNTFVLLCFTKHLKEVHVYLETYDISKKNFGFETQRSKTVTSEYFV